MLGIFINSNQPTNNMKQLTNNNTFIQSKAYTIAVNSLKKQIEAKRKLELRTKCLNRRFLIEENRNELTKLMEEINELRNELTEPLRFTRL